MSSPKSLIRRKAAKAVVVHSAHGTIAKARRRPARSGSLIGLGALLGTAIGFLLGRRRAPAATGTPATRAATTPEPAVPATAPMVGSPA